MSKDLNYAYDEYLKSCRNDAVRAIPEFHQKLSKTYFRYGDNTLPTFYKPLLITSQQEQMVSQVSHVLAQVINKASKLYFEERHLSYVFRLNSTAAELIKIDPGYSQSVVFSRYDALLDEGSLKLVEFNCDSPAGAAYTDQVEQVLLKEPMLQDFVKAYRVKQNVRARSIFNALIRVYEEFGAYEKPNIAIVDWRDVNTRPEFESIQAFFEAEGYKTVIADPRDLVYKNGHLSYDGLKIRLVLRRVIFDELLERLNEVQDLICAYRDRAVCLANPLRSRLAGTKALLSILTNPEYDHYFTDEENKIKREHIPWTRRLVDAEDFYGRKKIYLMDFLKDEKETLVLKPSCGYGGRGVTIGRETSETEWTQTIEKALQEDWVVQEYVDIPHLTVPAVVDGQLQFDIKKYNFNILVFDGQYSGGFTRLSSESVINVSRGGGLVPTMVSSVTPESI